MGLYDEIKRLKVDYDEDDDVYDSNDNEEAEEPQKRFFGIIGGGKPSQASAPQKKGVTNVCMIKPKDYNDCLLISSVLLEGRVLILNLENIETDLAQRIVDFTTGVCIAITGSFKNVSERIFIVTPKHIQITGDNSGDILEKNFNNDTE